jgi:hypothetical protein
MYVFETEDDSTGEVFCTKCGDTGEIATWGPDPGCAEYMDEPEYMCCDCVQGIALHIARFPQWSSPGALTTTREFRLLVASALTNGHYRQAFNQLRYTEDQFCVSGVACDLFARFFAHNVIPQWFPLKHGGYRFGFTADDAAQTFCPDIVEQLFNGISWEEQEDAVPMQTLIARNDGGTPFRVLAQMITGDIIPHAHDDGWETRD